MLFYSKRRKVARLVAAINARDVDASVGALHPDCQFIDREGQQVTGSVACQDLLERLMASDLAVRLVCQTMVPRGDDVLVRMVMHHSASADGERLLWRVAFADKAIARIESYRGGRLAGMVRLLRLTA